MLFSSTGCFRRRSKRLERLDALAIVRRTVDDSHCELSTARFLIRTNEAHTLRLAFDWRRLAHNRPESSGLLADEFGRSVVRRAGVARQFGRGIDGSRDAHHSARPADEMHAYGYGKAEYFSSGIEGALIVIAAVSIVWSAIPRLFAPQPLQQVGIGLMLSVLASVVNFGVARVLLGAGHKYRSITLEADARHLMTDVWTSASVIVGIGTVGLTGWMRLDPIIALIVAANIVWTGRQLLRRSVHGLMDGAVSLAEQDAIKEVLSRYRDHGVRHHALRTRQAGSRIFISLHILVPGDWTVQRGHDVLERMEADIRAALMGAH